MHARRLQRNVVTLITQVLVDAADPAFQHATKPIGPFLCRDEAAAFERRRGWQFIEVPGRGWRRVVPSPRPRAIIERQSIRRLLLGGDVVIAVGGGGIPVRELADGSLEGVDAVIDKDLASSLVAREIGATHLVMLTGEERAYLDYGTPAQRGLAEVRADQAQAYLEAGHFPAGSMGPKVEAAIEFVRAGGRCAVISGLDGLPEALWDARAATLIRP